MTDRVICPYCNKPAVLVDSEYVYGTSYGNLWICKICDAYVGCHRNTDKPIGTLANAELRAQRKEAHGAFDMLCERGGKMTRKEAYKWLADKMGKPKEETHIAMFDYGECIKAIELCCGSKYEI